MRIHFKAYPDRPFHAFRASRSGDGWILCSTTDFEATKVGRLVFEIYLDYYINTFRVRHNSNDPFTNSENLKIHRYTILNNF